MCSFFNAMLKELFILLGLLALAESAAKQYAYAYGTPIQGAFQCKDARKLFPILMSRDDDGGFNQLYNLGSLQTSVIVGGLWTVGDQSNTWSWERNLIYRVDQLISYMIKWDAYVKTHYIVVNSINADTAGVLFALNTLITRGIQKGLEVGIYTSREDRIRMTGNSTDLPDRVPLWWVNDGGKDGPDTPDNFDDFVPFGPWEDQSRIAMKQFSTETNDCGSGKSVYFV